MSKLRSRVFGCNNPSCFILAEVLLSSRGFQSQLLHFAQEHNGTNYDFCQQLKHPKASMFSQRAFLSIVSRSYFAAVCCVKMMMTVFKNNGEKKPTRLCVYHHRSETVPHQLCHIGSIESESAFVGPGDEPRSGAGRLTDKCGCEHDSLARKLEVTRPVARTLQQSGELKWWNVKETHL